MVALHDGGRRLRKLSVPLPSVCRLRHASEIHRNGRAGRFLQVNEEQRGGIDNWGYLCSYFAFSEEEYDVHAVVMMLLYFFLLYSMYYAVNHTTVPTFRILLLVSVIPRRAYNLII